MEQPVSTLAIQAAMLLGLRADWAVGIPAITPVLRDIAGTIRASARQAARRNRKLPPDKQLPINHALPYGISANLLESWPQVLAMSEDADVLRVLAMYRRLPKGLSQHLPIEAFCVAANFYPPKLLEAITSILTRQSAAAAAIITAVNQPRVVQKTIDRALEDDGFDDRKLFHQATGFLPTPQKGVNVRVNNNMPAQPAPVTNVAVVAPNPADVLRDAVTSIQEHRTKEIDITPKAAPLEAVVAVAPQAAPAAAGHAFLDVDEDEP